MTFTLTTPVGFLIFNRPDTTERVFEEIARAKPPKLMVVADGPRADRPGEAAKCAAARGIIDRVDWDCEVLQNYSDINLGMGVREATGMSWFFEQEEEVIILEDDTLPHPTFFRFCQDLLEMYRDDGRIVLISGDNHQFGRKRTEYSYYFSRYPQTWGWASWRRAWKYYDFEMKLWPQIRDGKWMHDYLGYERSIRYWTRIFDMVYEGKIDTWDYQWTLACWSQNGLTILPNVNMISNIGFGAEATTTKVSKHRLANLPVEAMKFPLQHPPFMIRDAQADDFLQRTVFSPGLLARALNKARRMMEHINAAWWSGQ